MASEGPDKEGFPLEQVIPTEDEAGIVEIARTTGERVLSVTSNELAEVTSTHAKFVIEDTDRLSDLGSAVLRINTEELDKRLQEDERKFAGGRLVVDYKRLEVRVDGENIGLTKKEYVIMDYLTRNKGRALTKSEILRYFWGGVDNISGNIMNVYISKLRIKLGDDLRKTIVTLFDIGFMFDDSTLLEP